MALTWNQGALTASYQRAADLLNRTAVDAVGIAKNTPGRFPARGVPGRNAPVQTGTYQRGIRIGKLATAQNLEASFGVFGVRYAAEIERKGAYGRPWRGKDNLSDAADIALRKNGLLR